MMFGNPKQIEPGVYYSPIEDRIVLAYGIDCYIVSSTYRKKERISIASYFLYVLGYERIGSFE